MLNRRRWLCLCVCARASAQTATRCRLVHGPGGGTTFTAFSASGQFALAAGTDTGEKPHRNVLMKTHNGGVDWSTLLIPDKAVSVFAPRRPVIWLVGARGLWESTDDGESWRLRHKAQGLLRIHFPTKQDGYAVGAYKTVLKTTNGGADWTALPEAEAVDANPAFTTFEWVDFVSPRVGIILGAVRPQRKGNTSGEPFWLDPRRRSRRPEWPATSITLQTHDGGATWKMTKTSLFGRITRMRYAPDGQGLALVEFHDRFQWPSEVFLVHPASGVSERVFRRKDRAVTDLLLFRGGASVLAAVEPPAESRRARTGILRILESADGKTWTDLGIPGELPAGRVWLAAAESGIWAASDSGYVLRCDAPIGVGF